MYEDSTDSQYWSRQHRFEGGGMQNQHHFSTFFTNFTDVFMRLSKLTLEFWLVLKIFYCNKSVHTEVCQVLLTIILTFLLTQFAIILPVLLKKKWTVVKNQFTINPWGSDMGKTAQSFLCPVDYLFKLFIYSSWVFWVTGEKSFLSPLQN